jgi:mRNA interferase RelE/StbE
VVAYKIHWEDEAGRAFRRLDKAVQKRLQKVVDRLEDNPRPAQATPLVGDPSTLRGRVGDWRILYEIDNDQQRVVILGVRHRSRAYGGH